MIKWSVLQLSSFCAPQNRSSLLKSVLTEFHELRIHEESMQTDWNRIRQHETVIGVFNNYLD
jgi:hypothetical protein